MDVQFRLLPDVEHPLLHNTEVKLFVGSAEMIARVRLIGMDQLLPGESGWLQLEMTEPVVAVRSDRYILRRPSPGETLGGGVVLDAHPKRRYKRFADSVLKRLKALAEGTPEEVLQQALLVAGAGPYAQVEKAANLEASSAKKAAEGLLAAGLMVILDVAGKPLQANTWVAARPYWEQQITTFLESLQEYHTKFPLRMGMPTEEMKSRMKISPQVFSALLTHLVAEEAVRVEGAQVRLTDHRVTFSAQQQARVDALLEKFAKSPFSPPTIKDAQAEIGEDLYQALVSLGRLLPVSHEVVFRVEDYQQAVADVKMLAEKYDAFTLAQARDYWQTTRRYVQDLLEYMDREGVTRRVGDVRKLRE
jgi:selenocysteine-specific elongation factor